MTAFERRRHGTKTGTGRTGTRARLAVAIASLCLALVGSGCAGAPLRPRTAPTAQEVPDVYATALQQALTRQYIDQVQRASGGYRIGPNDIIEIRVFEYEKMDTLARVGENGRISFPPLGEVQAAGLTERELEAALRERLRGKYLQDPHVIVFVKEPHAMEVAIVGEVEKPGRYSLLGEKHLVDLLAEAGGMTEKAGNVAYLMRFDKPGKHNPNDALTTRPPAGAPAPFGSKTRTIKIDLEGLLLRGEERWNVLLKSGDVVNVAEAGSVHVTGPGVEKPGTYPLTRTAKTLSQIIDEAGGLKFEASRRLVVLRDGDDGEEDVIPIDYRKVLRDKRNDVVLLSGDTVLTRRTPIKGVLAVIGRGIEKILHIGVYGTYAVPLG